MGREDWAVDCLLSLVDIYFPEPGLIRGPYTQVSHWSCTVPPTRAMFPKNGASENLGLSFGGVAEPPQGSPFLCIVARRSCPLGCAPPPAAVSPAS